jgi:hypothetical protein
LHAAIPDQFQKITILFQQKHGQTQNLPILEADELLGRTALQVELLHPSRDLSLTQRIGEDGIIAHLDLAESLGRRTAQGWQDEKYKQSQTAKEEASGADHKSKTD